MRQESDIASSRGTSRDGLRRFFWYLNRYFMVPAFRIGLGPLIGSPLTGYIMVLETIGRRTGRVRYTPLNYAIRDGQVYCLAGWGSAAHWFRNLSEHPSVACILPGTRLVGVAEMVTDPGEALAAVRQVLSNAGFVGFAAGLNPFTVTDELLREKTRDVIVVRIRPTQIDGGSGDPGGWFWIVSWAMHAVLIAWLIGRWRRRERR
jgi:deazaflavin-dependent oxidoreductase (nitroreductase family)